DADGLRVGLAIDNLEDRPVPAGLGLHPFFTREADTELAFRAAAVWLGDAEVLPTEKVPLPAAWNHALTRRLVSGLDNCFVGWDGVAVVSWPGRRLRLDVRATRPFR